MTHSLTVSLIMPVLNEQDSVENTLNAVFSSSRLPDEIIVADAFSTDRTVSIIEQFNGCKGVSIKIVNNPGIFAGAGRNIAVTNCTGDIVLLLDFGNLIDNNWISEMIRPFESDASIDSVAGVFKPLAQSDYEMCVAAIQYYSPMAFNKLSRKQQQKLKPKCAKSGGLGLAIRKKLWNEMGGMPSWLRAGEDFIFSRKICASGLKVYAALDALLYHHIRCNSLQVFKQNYIYSKGSAQIGMADKNLPIVISVYSLFIFLMVTSLLMPINLFLAILISFLYIYLFGIRRINKIYSKPPKKHYLYSFLILVARDFGTVFGALSGWVCWLTQKQYKDLFVAYYNKGEFSKIRRANEKLNN